MTTVGVIELILGRPVVYKVAYMSTCVLYNVWA